MITLLVVIIFSLCMVVAVGYVLFLIMKDDHGH